MDEAQRQALDTLFDADSALYRDRGFQRRIGWGKKPALINIDLANAWTREGNPFSCEGMDTILPATCAVLAAFRARGLPIVFTTTAYDVVAGEHSDMGLWGRKIPAEVLQVGSSLVEIDERLERRADEILIVKKQASAFRGTPLNSYLNACNVDTVVLTGATASACVRASVEDAIADGFRPIVVRECIGDRIAGAVEWNLYDIDAKFGDVEPLQAVLDHLRQNADDDID